MESDHITLKIYQPSTNQREEAKKIYSFAIKLFILIAFGCIAYFLWNSHPLWLDLSSPKEVSLSEAIPHSYFFILMLFLMAVSIVYYQDYRKESPISEEDLIYFHVMLENGLRDSKIHDQVVSFFNELEKANRLPIYGDMSNLSKFYVELETARTKKKICDNHRNKEWTRIKEELSREIAGGDLKT